MLAVVSNYASRAIWVLVVSTISLLLVNIIRGVLKHRSKRRRLRHIPGPRRHSIFTGNLVELFDAVQGLAFYDSLSTYGGVARIHGLFGDVSLVISDPRALAHILVKDSSDYPSIDVAGSIDTQRWLFGPGLVGSNGPTHRRQRKMLNPAFSHAQCKRVAPLLSRISRQLRQKWKEEVAKYAGLHSGARMCEIDVAEWFGRSSLESIAQCGFGHTFQALEGDGSAYVRALKEIVPVVGAIGPMLRLGILCGCANLPPSFLRALGDVASLVYQPLRELIRIKDTYHVETRAIWDARRATLKTNVATEHKNPNPVLLDVLLDETGEGRVSEEELISQAISLVFGGTETTSTLLSRILHLFTLHPSVQDRLRSELHDASTVQPAGSGDESDGLGYDALMPLSYLDAICKETLRLFAPVPFRPRRSVADSIVPLADGTSLHIPADTEILVNIHGVNTNKHIWGDDALIWNPERWLAPLPPSLADAKVPGVYANQLTFFSGPKACIGLNFALISVKTMLATLVPAFKFSLPSEHEIEWRFAQTITPSVKGEKGLNPRMPLRVEMLE